MGFPAVKHLYLPFLRLNIYLNAQNGSVLKFKRLPQDFKGKYRSFFKLQRHNKGCYDFNDGG